MNITPTEMEWLDRNGDYLCLSNVEGTGEYISRKRRADLVKIVSRVLRDELSDNERKVLLDMVTQDKSATDLMKELNTSSSQIYVTVSSRGLREKWLASGPEPSAA